MKKIHEILYRRIENSGQRYPTVGDYWQDGKVWHFRVSHMKDPRFEMLVLIHELVEFVYTQVDGISEKQITEFDLMFERERERGLHKSGDEPGWDKRAPYRKHHAFAERIERIVAKRLGVNWDEYSEAVNGL